MVWRCEKLTLLPYCLPLPVRSHICIEGYCICFVSVGQAYFPGRLDHRDGQRIDKTSIYWYNEIIMARATHENQNPQTQDQEPARFASGLYVPTTFQRRLLTLETPIGLSEWDMATERLVVRPDALADRERNFELVERLVGHTPLIPVEQIGTSAIFSKVESDNPSESHYDRAYVATIKRLEHDGVIKPGDTLLEITSGSAGNSFTWAATRLGYRPHIIVPPELPKARIQEMVNFGAKVEISRSGNVPAAADRLKEYLFGNTGLEFQRHRTDDYSVFVAETVQGNICAINHSENDITIKAFEEIPAEIIEEIPGHHVDYVVSALGNWTTTTAFHRGFQELGEKVKIVGIENVDNPDNFVLRFGEEEFERRFGRKPSFKTHQTFGMSVRGVRIKYRDPDILDDIELVDQLRVDQVRDTYNQGKEIVETIGNTSAASLLVARQLALEHPGSKIVVFFYDKADRYGEPREYHLKFMYQPVPTTMERKRAARKLGHIAA